MVNLQESIRNIQRDDSLTSIQKKEKIKEIMLNNNKKNIEPKKNITPKTININCSHYNRGCSIFCNQCFKYYPCRVCHDNMEDHKINQFNIKSIQCRKCLFLQPPSQNCTRCKSIFGFYYCTICNLWESSNNKKIFHCDKCGICRLGKKDEYIHCIKCKICISCKLYNQHKCIENSIESNCPICSEYMFDHFNKEIAVLKCGHTIHNDCLKTMISNNKYKCPICQKSMCDMKEKWLSMDQIKANEFIPDEFRNKRLIILCNDCEKKSDISFSFDYKKCYYCSGYNTTEVESYI